MGGRRLSDEEKERRAKAKAEESAKRHDYFLRAKQLNAERREAAKEERRKAKAEWAAGAKQRHYEKLKLGKEHQEINTYPVKDSIMTGKETTYEPGPALFNPNFAWTPIGEGCMWRKRRTLY